MTTDEYISAQPDAIVAFQAELDQIDPELIGRIAKWCGRNY